MAEHSREEILGVLKGSPVAAIATAAGDRMRNRMMHFAVDDDFNIYLATMKGDPKTLQITHHPGTALLVHKATPDLNDSQEVEINGAAVAVRDPQERARALEMTAARSPVVAYLTQSGNAGLLDCVKIAPETVKFRVFKEIVQGMPPTVLEFPQNRQAVSDGYLLKMKLRDWFIALRSPFLVASLVPVLLGGAAAWFDRSLFNWWFFLLTLVAGLSIHAAANIINDYFDHRSGNDDANREFVRPFSGGSRVIQLGLLTPLEVLLMSLFFFGLAAFIGSYLTWTRGAPVLALGIVGALSGMFYTARPFNWASRGLGEAMVGLNFGPLMTLGAYYVQTQTLSWMPVVAGLPLGFLIAAVLYINEFPDVTADRSVGKRTLVVRLGRSRAVLGYIALMAGVYLSLAYGVAAGFLPPVSLVAVASLPLAVWAVILARKYHASSFDLAPANALTVVSHVASGLLLAMALLWAGLNSQEWLFAPLLALGLGFIAYMTWTTERQRKAFVGLKKVIR